MSGTPALSALIALVVIGCTVALIIWWRRSHPSDSSASRTSSGTGGTAGPHGRSGEASTGGLNTVVSMLRGETAGAEAVRAQIRLRFYQVALGNPAVAAGVAPGHEGVAAAVHDTLVDIAAQPNYAPRRPMLLPKLLQAVNDSDVSRRELAGIIASDPALTGNLLRLANSSFYRVDSQPVESIDRAVALLGTEGIRSLIATALMQPVFRVGAGEFAQFPEITWEHTCRCASAAEAHAAIVENSDPFAGQLLGLLLGLAGIVIFRVTLDQYAAHELRVDAGTLMALLETHAAPVASQIAASWELSERIGRALADQTSHGGADTLSPLGRSLGFGSVIGALAVLYLQGLCQEDEVQTMLADAGHGHRAVTRIWERLTAPKT